MKVLLDHWSDDVQREAFDAEAELLARLSTHPSIVTMYEAGLAADGRPYLAMEYCSRPSMGARFRTERIAVPEALRVAVQIAGAVETAHRAGILHRDIKPANILITDYGHPVLTDFGISGTLDGAVLAQGMSVPWSPPEFFESAPHGGVGSDVWALAATLYSLLAGRSPFEVVGGPNSNADLIARISHDALPSIERSDVPRELERVLATAMAKTPGRRYPRMIDFARALQRIQGVLALAVTPVDLVEDVDPGAADDDRFGDVESDAGTRLRRVVTIDPLGGPSPGRPAGGGRDPAAAAARGSAEPGASPRTGLWLAVAGSVVVGAVIGGAILLHTEADRSGSEPTSAARPVGGIEGLVLPVVALAGHYDDAVGAVVFTWRSDPRDRSDNTYAWRVVDSAAGADQPAAAYAQCAEPRASVPAEPGTPVCIEVVAVHSGQYSYEPVRTCVTP